MLVTLPEYSEFGVGEAAPIAKEFIWNYGQIRTSQHRDGERTGGYGGDKIGNKREGI